jgi:ribosomal RNA-processing protein 12
LPILFNLYTTAPVGAEESGQRMSVLETIKLFFNIADSALLCEMFDKAFGRANDETTEIFVRDSCLELLRAMLSFVDTSRVKMVYDMGMVQLASKDHKVQKRSYRVLEEICGSTSQGRFFQCSAQ